MHRHNPTPAHPPLCDGRLINAIPNTHPSTKQRYRLARTQPAEVAYFDHLSHSPNNVARGRNCILFHEDSPAGVNGGIQRTQIKLCRYKVQIRGNDLKLGLYASAINTSSFQTKIIQECSMKLNVE